MAILLKILLKIAIVIVGIAVNAMGLFMFLFLAVAIFDILKQEAWHSDMRLYLFAVLAVVDFFVLIAVDGFMAKTIFPKTLR